MAGALIGDENKYDTEFWRIRSPLEQIDKITAPTFVVGGLNDIFQRGEPLIYEGLKDHTTAKLLIGPWEHLDGSSGAGLPADGVPALANIRLAWFDQYLKGMDTGAGDPTRRSPSTTPVPNAMSPPPTGHTPRPKQKPFSSTASPAPRCSAVFHRAPPSPTSRPACCKRQSTASAPPVPASGPPACWA